MSLKILEEKEAIREVIDRFSNLECDVPAQQALFTKDAHIMVHLKELCLQILIHTKDAHIMVHMGGILAMDIHGSEEMRNQFEGFTKTVKASHHMNGQQVIEIEGSTATDTHYCRAALITEENGKTYITDNYIRYVDTLVKEEGTWKISIRDQYFVIVEKREMKA